MRTRATVAREHVLQDREEQDGEMTETVRLQPASRPMSLILAVYR